MKQLAPLMTLSICLTLTAITTASAQGNSRVYIMKKDGKLTEVNNGVKSAVTQDVTLPNHATVHPDGSVDDKDGNKRQMEEGDYISFVDGRIRKLSASAAPANTATTASPAPSTTTTKPAATKKPATKPANKS
jgi:hypothetical protein